MSFTSACLLVRFAFAAVLALPLATATLAQSCGSGGEGFDRWIATYKGRAKGHGISAGAIERALSGVNYNRRVIGLDRGQKSFKLSFEQFYARRVSTSMIRRGHGIIAQRKGLFDRIESRFGVPAEILVSIWGLETNYGGDNLGKFSIIESLATLAYDCRRSAFFENELTNALRIIDRGDISVERMRGGWAGEIGPMQFLPSSYVKYSVDFDGDGHRDLFRSVPDMLASTANYFKQKGWQSGQSWGEGTHNYGVIREWNKAEVYVRTIATMAQKMR
ncbi:MAG: lytic transglycosylase domain-containing protein [Hyphomicrobiaceae bacterium]